MKPVFKCEYCDFMGTEDQVRIHEQDCFDNYDKRSCSTCSHRGFVNYKQYKCACGEEIPEGMEIRYCKKYERKEKSEPFKDIFSGLFGGL